MNPVVLALGIENKASILFIQPYDANQVEDVPGGSYHETA
tara:strand:- start:439 stop:558 length:120 start_codon:yes stop_codon:yes gene_type:complete